jgi:hypothetical protein
MRDEAKQQTAHQEQSTPFNPSASPLGKKLDPDTERMLALLAEQERVKASKVPGVRTVLVVLSAKGMVFDRESLRQKILLTYPEAAVFFRTTLGRAVGVESPRSVDLLIDFTGPGQRQALFHERALRRVARFAVGRDCGFFRKKLYDRVLDERRGPEASMLPKDILARERLVQRLVLASVGVPLAQTGDALPDRGKTIALELPPMSRV